MLKEYSMQPFFLKKGIRNIYLPQNKNLKKETRIQIFIDEKYSMDRSSGQDVQCIEDLRSIDRIQ